MHYVHKRNKWSNNFLKGDTDTIPMDTKSRSQSNPLRMKSQILVQKKRAQF